MAKRVPFDGYDESKDAFGEPQDFYGIDVYPILVKDYQTINKMTLLYLNNKVEDEPMFRQMGLLKYLLFIGNMSEDQSIPRTLQSILEKVFQQKVEFQFSLTKKSERMEYYENFTVLIYLNEYMTEADLHKYVNMLRFYIYLPESDKTIYGSMFQRLKDLILFQNYLPADDYRVSSKEAFDDFERTRASLFKKYQHRGLFQDMIIYKTITHEDIDYIKENVTWKSFKATIDRFGKIMSYMAVKPLEMSGQIKYKDKNYKTDNWGDYIEPSSYYDGIVQPAKKTIDNLKKLT